MDAFEKVEAMQQIAEGAANFLRGMSMDQRIPSDAREAAINKADAIDAAILAEADK